MSIQDIHFIREVLITDYQGTNVATMQVSRANASYSHPIFKAAAFYESDEVRTLYLKLGGSRHEGAEFGSTVIIPNRSRWAQLWGISAEDVQVVASTNSPARGHGYAPHNEQARARDRLMRD